MTRGIKFQGEGQGKSVTFPRFVVSSPQLVVLDEPFNGLDALMAARIWHNISNWINQRSVFLLSQERPAYLSNEIAIKHLSLD